MGAIRMTKMKMEPFKTRGAQEYLRIRNIILLEVNNLIIFER